MTVECFHNCIEKKIELSVAPIVIYQLYVPELESGSGSSSGLGWDNNIVGFSSYMDEELDSGSDPMYLEVCIVLK